MPERAQPAAGVAARRDREVVDAALAVAEWMVADSGYGFRLRLYYQKTDMTVVYVYLLVLGAIGYSIDAALIQLRRKLCPWFGNNA